MSNTDTWIPSGVMYNFSGAVIQNFANGNALKYDSYHLSVVLQVLHSYIFAFWTKKLMTVLEAFFLICTGSQI